MSDDISHKELISDQKKELKILQAKIQKLKHGVSKGDKKKKKEVALEIAQLTADLQLKHENELKAYKANSVTGTSSSDELTSTANDNESKGHLDGLEGGGYVYNSQSDTTAQKLTKAQKRRNKKTLLAREREKAIAEQEVESLTSKRNLEMEKIKQKLSERNLSIFEIPSDGDCLYKAIEHQLITLNLEPKTVQWLRESTSKYMLEHMEDYLPFLTDSGSGDVLSEAQYVQYCEDVATTPAWGGHVEIQVLSHVCGRPIEVIQGDGPSVFAGDETSMPKLILSYHRHVYGLGEHYNSVISADSSEEVLTNKLGSMNIQKLFV